MRGRPLVTTQPTRPVPRGNSRDSKRLGVRVEGDQAAQHAALLVEQVDAAAVGVEELARLIGDHAQHGDQVERGGDRAGRPDEGLRFFRPAAGLAVQPGVADGDGGHAADALGDSHLLRSEDLSWMGGEQTHGADHLVAVSQRQAEEPARSGRAPSG